MITLQQANELCTLAHENQWRRPRGMNKTDRILFSDKLDSLSEEDDYDVDVYTINHHRFSWSEGAEEWFMEEPYHTHPQAVAAMMNTEYRKILALLHDVIEDTAYELTNCMVTKKCYIVMPDKEQYAISHDLYIDLELLTKDPNLTYRENIRRIKDSGRADPIAVKIADNCNNLSTGTDKQKERYLTVSLPILLKD